MTIIEGNLLTGMFDDSMTTFTLQQVKHLYTETTLSKRQVEEIYHYLKSKNSDGQILSLYDQVLIHLSHEEQQKLIDDLEKIKLQYQ